VPDGSKHEFTLFAYRALDDLFPTDLPALPQEPELLQYVRIGYDIVERNPARLGFGCSPLSCNSMAENILVNDFCLLDDLESALSTAQRFEIARPEPGPYIVIEVLAAL
jgi:hypothetical protein